MDTEKLNGAFRALAIATTELLGEWLESLPEEQRDDLEDEFKNWNALPGIRFLLGDERRPAKLTILKQDRVGEIETIGEIELSR